MSVRHDDQPMTRGSSRSQEYDWPFAETGLEKLALQRFHFVIFKLSRQRLFGRGAWILAICILLGCVTPRNFRLPKDRITRGTPYTLTNKEVEIGLTIMGQDEDDLAASLEFRLGKSW